MNGLDIGPLSYSRLRAEPSAEEPDRLTDRRSRAMLVTASRASAGASTSAGADAARALVAAAEPSQSHGEVLI
jgi:hypothetical protein